MVAIIGVGISFAFYRKKKKNRKTRAKIFINEKESDLNNGFEQQTLDQHPYMKWESNSLYSSHSSEADCEEKDIYPEWLRKRKEMLFNSCNLERGQKLGCGNYGSVYKGKLLQGNAV